jgi:hypothetical protein
MLADSILIAIKKCKVTKAGEFIVHLSLEDHEGCICMARVASSICETIIGLTAKEFKKQDKEYGKVFKNATSQKFSIFAGVCIVQYDTNAEIACYGAKDKEISTNGSTIDCDVSTSSANDSSGHVSLQSKFPLLIIERQ